MNNPVFQTLALLATKNARYHEEQSETFAVRGDQVIEYYDPEKVDDGIMAVTRRFEKRAAPRLDLIPKANGWDLAVRHKAQAIDAREEAEMMQARIEPEPERNPIPGRRVKVGWAGGRRADPELVLWHRGFRRYSQTNPKAFVGLDRNPV